METAIGIVYKVKDTFSNNLKYSTIGSLMRWQLLYHRKGRRMSMINMVERVLHWLGN